MASLQNRHRRCGQSFDMSERKDATINQAHGKVEDIPENSANFNTMTFVSSIPKNSSSRQPRQKSRYHCVKSGNPQVSSEHERKGRKLPAMCATRKSQRPTSCINRSLSRSTISPSCHLSGVRSCRCIERKVGAVCIILSYVAKSTVSCFVPFICCRHVQTSIVMQAAVSSGCHPS
jgi:hypothetical protein